MMTRKDYQAIAAAVREGLDYAEDEGWVVEYTAVRIADALEQSGGYDTNGNRRFKRDRFLSACGVSES